jgi:HlyD family secretion protein
MNARMLCLALLEHCPMSGYEIRKLVSDGFVSHFTEASYGSIYPALDKLEAEGLIAGREERDPGKPPRRVYDITPEGRTAFIAALHEPIEPDLFRSSFLLVAANAPLVDKAHLAGLIDERLANDRAELADMEEQLGRMPAEADPACTATRWTMEYGVHMIRASIAFLTENRARLQALASGTPQTRGMPSAPAGPRQKKTKSMRVIPLLLAALLGGALSLPPRAAQAETGRPAAPATESARAPSVTVVAARRETLIERLPVTGSFVAREEVLVAPQVDGLAIIEILAEEGDRVARDQVLVRLDRAMLDVHLAQNTAQLGRAEAAIAQARANIAEAESSLTQATQSLERARQLARTGATSADILDQRIAAASAAQARREASRQALALAEADQRLIAAQRRDIELRLARTEVRARVDGLVSRRTARLGALAMASGEPLFRIIEAGDIELEADVPETTLARLRAGQPAEIEPIGRGESLPGRVRLVAPEINRTSRLGRVRIAVDGNAIAVGSFGRAVVEIARADGVTIPISAVMFGAGGASVQVVKDDVIETRRVTVGVRSERTVEIREGLAAGEEIVSISGTFLRSGDRVRPVRSDDRTARN